MTSDSGTSMPAPAVGAPSGAALPPKRLTRSRSDRWVAGVAGGIAQYFGVDPVLVRLAFVLLTVASGGVALVFYVVGMVVVPEDASASAPRVQGAAAGGLVFGLILVGIGGIWLLRALDVNLPRWDVLLAAGLIVVGVGLVLTAGRAGSGLLVALGLLLTVALSGASTLTLPVDNAFGDSLQRPLSMPALQREYSHAFGSFTLDLTKLELPEGTTRIRVATSFGETRVRLPAGVGARVQASTVFGQARVLGETFAGVGTNQAKETPDFATAPRRVEIELNTAFGSTEVTR